MKDAQEELAIQLARGQVIPFVGAGVSMSLGLPSYGALIQELGGHIGFDGAIFEQLGDYLTLAEFYHLRKSGLLELQAYLREKWGSVAQPRRARVSPYPRRSQATACVTGVPRWVKRLSTAARTCSSTTWRSKVRAITRSPSSLKQRILVSTSERRW